MKAFKFSILMLGLLFLFPSWVYTQEKSINASEIKYFCHNWVPMSFVDSNGIPKGLYVEIVNEIFVNNLNKKVAVQIRPWKRAQVNVKRGKGDFLITVATPERLKYTVRSEEPIFLLYLYVYTYTNHPLEKQINQIRTAEDIINLDLLTVTNLGNGWHHNNLEKKGVRTHYVGAEESTLSFLAARRADIVIDALVSTNYLIKKRGLSSRLTLTKSRFGPLKMYLLMSKKSQFLNLMPEINKIFAKLQKEGKIEKIVNRYSAFE